ncbi:MAG: Lipid A export ATP-binding/permease protein MsbA [Betaproteobacteria bacterium ADurb.Bin341]|nr:MAG: Lipid A export ATP-binding/permease protein MsbA [Betaproteobacteria bacterium ADurb.Bin341]
MFAPIRCLLGLLTPVERGKLVFLLVINTLAALTEVLGVFSILPFLAVAGDPAVVDRQPLLRQLFEWSGASTGPQFVFRLGLLTIGALLLTNIVGIVSIWYRTRFCYGIMAAMSDRLFRGYLAQPYTFFLRRNTNILAKDLLNEVHQFFTNIIDPATSIVARGLQLLFVIGALIAYNWRAAFAVGVLFGGFYVVVYLLFQRRLQRMGKVRWACNELRYRVAGEALGGMKEVRLFGRESWYADKFKTESDRQSSLLSRTFIYSASPRYILETLAFGALVAYILLQLHQGRNLADVLPLLGVFAVAGVRLMPAVQIVFQYASTLRSNWVSVERLNVLFREVGALGRTPRLLPHAVNPLALQNSFELDDVRFTYPGTETPVLRGITLSIPSKACIGLCGSSGAGKTTLMDICLGLISPDSGEIRVDGKVLSGDLRRAWQRNVGYVPQQIYLLDGSIAANIAFGVEAKYINRQAVERAARMASLHEFISGLPAGYDTGVGERGIRLSGGQRQRIAIARALYHDPEVLFFDEATSALDTETEHMIVESIQNLARQKTIVIVAHRLTTLRYCDAIYSLNAGRVESRKTYAELVGGS